MVVSSGRCRLPTCTQYTQFASVFSLRRNQFMAVKKTFTSFQDMLAQSDRPVLVDFYADWCGPCRMMASILQDVRKQLKNQLNVVKIDTEKYPNLASQYQIHALPTLVLFKNGEPVDRIEGVMVADALIQRVKPLL